MFAVHMAILILALPSCISAEFQDREEIVTIFSGSKPFYVTSGNGNLNEIDYQLMKLNDNNDDEKSQYKVDPETKDQLESFNVIKNRLIVDFSNEDPKQFLPEKPNYYKVASKRGFIFTTIAVFMGICLFSLFYIRIFKGDCGGYNTIIKKPSKKRRYTIFTRILVGMFIFLFGFILTFYFSLTDRKLSLNAAHSLMIRNKNQLLTIQKIMKDIRRINKNKFNVIYSVLSYENFQIGTFLEGIDKQYETSLNNANEINNLLFIGTKNNFFIKLMFILLSVIVLIISWLFIYKNRSLTNALLITFLLGLVGVYMMHVMGSSFSYFSIFTEMCNDSLDAFNPDKADLRVRFDNSFQSFLTCLPQKETELMTAQINSLLIAENTLLLILRNFIHLVMKQEVKDYDGLKKASHLMKHQAKILELIRVKPANSQQMDYLFQTNMMNVFNAAIKIPEIYYQAKDLHNCKELSEFNNQMNTTTCKDGLNSQFWGLILFFISFIGLCLVLSGVYSSENVIRGLYNEEIQYVKTNKLRYDWN